MTGSDQRDEWLDSSQNQAVLASDPTVDLMLRAANLRWWRKAAAPADLTTQRGAASRALTERTS